VPSKLQLYVRHIMHAEYLYNSEILVNVTCTVRSREVAAKMTWLLQHHDNDEAKIVYEQMIVLGLSVVPVTGASLGGE